MKAVTLAKAAMLPVTGITVPIKEVNMKLFISLMMFGLLMVLSVDNANAVIKLPPPPPVELRPWDEALGNPPRGADKPLEADEVAMGGRDICLYGVIDCSPGAPHPKEPVGGYVENPKELDDLLKEWLEQKKQEQRNSIFDVMASPPPDELNGQGRLGMGINTGGKLDTDGIEVAMGGTGICTMDFPSSRCLDEDGKLYDPRRRG